ncbi:MAG: 2-keto-4-pentenoate hydratase [Geminicoccaceae bacterium]
MDRIKQAGWAIAQARLESLEVEELPGGAILSREEAERIQTAATRATGLARSGWKIGCTSAEAMRLLNTDQPFYGPLFEPYVFEPGSEVPLPAGTKGFECELAFRLGRHLPPRDGAYDETEVKAAIASLHPAIELVASRLARLGLPNGTMAFADFGSNGAFIPGPAIADWDRLDLSALTVRALKRGEEVAQGSSKDVMGSPLTALTWLANQGLGLKAGEWVSTGTCTGLVSCAAGDTLVCDIVDQASVEIDLVSRS